jgi:hypothetical protein
MCENHQLLPNLLPSRGAIASAAQNSDASRFEWVQLCGDSVG